MALQMDPAVMAKMQGFVPMMLKQMPEITKKVEEATASLPKPRKWQDLTRPSARIWPAFWACQRARWSLRQGHGQDGSQGGALNPAAVSRLGSEEAVGRDLARGKSQRQILARALTPLVAEREDAPMDAQRPLRLQIEQDLHRSSGSVC
jgi:hypothetical protein